MGPSYDGAGIQFLRTHTEQLYDQHTMMRLNIGNESFWMTLAPGVPALLQEIFEGFLVKLLEPLGLSDHDISHWGTHPGGPKIVPMLGTVGVVAGAIACELGRPRELRQVRFCHGGTGARKHPAS